MRKPHHRDYHTDDGLHAAMEGYAEFRSSKGVLAVRVVFQDGSGADGVFSYIARAKVPIPYKTRDGEIYEVERRTGKFVDPVWGDLQPLSRAEMEKAATDWLNHCDSVKEQPPKSIKFKIEED